MQIKAVLCMAAALVLAGCAGMPTLEQERQIASSGQIGCAPSEISIGSSERYTWTAACKGKVFQCTVAPAIACKEAIKAPA